jgi:hypothetical protein
MGKREAVMRFGSESIEQNNESGKVGISTKSGPVHDPQTSERSGGTNQSQWNELRLRYTVHGDRECGTREIRRMGRIQVRRQRSVTTEKTIYVGIQKA